MAKKNKKDKEAKKARAEAKNKKNQQKAAAKDKKMMNKLAQDSDDEGDVDIDTILANFKLEQEQYEQINVETVTRPSKRINPCLITNPLHKMKEIILFGGEYTNNETGSTQFFNDLFTYSSKGQHLWKRYTSQNSPMPRSSAAMCSHPSGVALLHGGEFSSPKQSSFYHYNDTWLLDTQTKEWTKIESKVGPSARSGHRITTWKNYFVLFGGFRDLGSHTTYLNDTWLFDLSKHKWQQLEFPKTQQVPDARSGHSLIPFGNGDGVLVYGGYCKIKAKKNLQKGKILTDYWVLKPTATNDISSFRWERRKRQGFQPSPRVGCSMAYHKGRGVLFGGVYDYDETEESMESEYYNDLFSYNVESNRWFNLNLRKRQGKTDGGKVSGNNSSNVSKEQEKELQDLLNKILEQNDVKGEDDEEGESDGEDVESEDDSDDNDNVENFTVATQLPHARFNSSTTVMNDSLYIYGGVWEHGDKDFVVDSFYSVDLNRVDGVNVYWEDLKEMEAAKRDGLASEDEFESDYEDDEDDSDGEGEVKDEKLVAEDEDEESDLEEEEQEEQEMEIPDERPWLPHPKPFETLREFYIRCGPQFLEWAISQNRKQHVRGKLLKQKSFELCQDRWWERRDQSRIDEEKLEEIGVTENVVERDTSKPQQRRR